MEVNKKQTQKYYENYEPCLCSYCQNYISQIDNYPKIQEYLESLGIDQTKPFELIPIDDDLHDKVYYYCQYIVFGSCDEEIIKSIDGIFFTLSKYHPDTQIKEDHFVIEFGIISLNKSKELFPDHLYLKDRIIIINHVLYKIDPTSLAKLHCPKDEYMIEAKEIAERVNNSIDASLVDEIYNVFKEYLNEELSKETCKLISKNIYLMISNLKSAKISNENELVIKFHDNFVIKEVDNYLYINEKEYNHNNLLKLIKNISKYVFIQNNDSYKKVAKKHFNLSKYLNRKDAELIIDKSSVIYDANDLKK